MEDSTARATIKLLIVDDHPVVRVGLNSMLRKQPGLSVIGAAHSGAEALALLTHSAVDVLLLDLHMPKMSGIDTLHALRQLPSPPHVIILSSFEFEEEIYRAVEAGAEGYLLKDTSRTEIIRAIYAVQAGKTYFPQRIVASLEERKLRSGLTPRELEILEMLSKGLTNKEIARGLAISQYTVRNHINRITNKLGVSDRTEAATVAIQQGILIVSR
jgi:two-component system NarL family response regulator